MALNDRPSKAQASPEDSDAAGGELPVTAAPPLAEGQDAIAPTAVPVTPDPSRIGASFWTSRSLGLIAILVAAVILLGLALS